MPASDIDLIRFHLPEPAWPPVAQWMQEHAVHVRVVRARRTKLGDYRVPRDGGPPRITVNAGLNPYAFLVTLVHEFAHHTAFLQDRRSAPHGPVWRAEYQRVMRPFLSPAVLPLDVLTALNRHLQRAPASSCADPQLIRALHRHDPEPGLLLERLPERTLFHFNGSIFVKGPRLRKRFRCRCLNNRRSYLLDPLVEVVTHDPAMIGNAS